MQKSLFLLVFTLLLLFSSSSLAISEDFVNVYRDGYIEDISRSQNVPLDGVPDEVSDTNSLLAGRGEFFDEFNSIRFDGRIIMTFDISSYTSMTLSSAFLSGWGTRVDNRGALDPIGGDFFLYSGDGLLSVSDFNTPATFVGSASFQDDGIPGSFDLSPFQVDVTAGLQTLINNPLSNYAEFRVTSENPTVYIAAGEADPGSFFSIDPQLAPILKVNVVPEPVSSVLALLGGGAMVLRRRYKFPGRQVVSA